MKNLLDILVGLALFLILLIPMVFISLIIKLMSEGPILFWSDRVGQNNVLFKMPKFRTMKVDTPPFATHLLENPESYYTAFGSFLRKSSLDELPQLWSILKGDMGFIGPRPALFNQKDLIDLRTSNKIHTLKPGLTGWAQVNGRDELSIQEKINYEVEYLDRKSFLFDMYIIWLTLLKIFKKEGISH